MQISAFRLQTAFTAEKTPSTLYIPPKNHACVSYIDKLLGTNRDFLVTNII